MSKVRELAEQMFRDYTGCGHASGFPFSKRPKLDDLWLADQEKWLQLAERALQREREKE